jgi:hypothetical protein
VDDGRSKSLSQDPEVPGRPMNRYIGPEEMGEDLEKRVREILLFFESTTSSKAVL